VSFLSSATSIAVHVFFAEWPVKTSLGVADCANKRVRRGADLQKRFIFRQFYYADLCTFLTDGEVRAINHEQP
jgi:hypothetical protein